MRRALLASGVAITGTLAMRDPEPAVATAAPARAPLATFVRARPGRTVASLLARRATAEPAAETTATSALSRRALDRWHRVYRLAGMYRVAPELARSIHDIALAEGIEPELAFRLVRADSEFNEHATSRVGAVGLTQVMPGTAEYYVRGISRERLYDPHLNLHVGFRYLRGLIHEYKSLRLALLVYNRGPVAVDAALKRGDDPANGYEDAVAKGYRGKGTVGFPPPSGRVASGDFIAHAPETSPQTSLSR